MRNLETTIFIFTFALLAGCSSVSTLPEMPKLPIIGAADKQDEDLSGLWIYEAGIQIGLALAENTLIRSSDSLVILSTDAPIKILEDGIVESLVTSNLKLIEKIGGVGEGWDIGIRNYQSPVKLTNLNYLKQREIKKVVTYRVESIKALEKDNSKKGEVTIFYRIIDVNSGLIMAAEALSI